MVKGAVTVHQGHLHADSCWAKSVLTKHTWSHWLNQPASHAGLSKSTLKPKPPPTYPNCYCHQPSIALWKPSCWSTPTLDSLRREKPSYVFQRAHRSAKAPDETSELIPHNSGALPGGGCDYSASSLSGNAWSARPAVAEAFPLSHEVETASQLPRSTQWECAE